MDPDWLDRARRLQALAQSGLTFTHDAYDRERYEAIRAIAAQMIAAGAGTAGTPGPGAGTVGTGTAGTPGPGAGTMGAGTAGAPGPQAGTVSAGAADMTCLLERLFAAQSGYATPKVDVRAAIFHAERVLLVRERSDGGWTLPGGWADVGESPSRAVQREVLEESGYAVRVAKLAAVFDRDLHPHTPHLFHIWKLFFLCELDDGAQGARRDLAPASAGASSHETDAADFFAVDALPPLSLGRVTAAQIAHMLEHHRNPERPTTFD